MAENTLITDNVQADAHGVQPGMTELHAAQRMFKQDSKQGLAELNKLFRSGAVPKPSLNGRYPGELVALDLAPGLTQFFQSLTKRWMPWLGKTFDAAHGSGDNIFTQDSYLLARFFNPVYRGFVTDGAGRYRGFSFHTYI